MRIYGGFRAKDAASRRRCNVCTHRSLQFLLRRTTKDMPGPVAERDIAFFAPMSARELKSEPFQSLNIARMRTGEGKAKRKVLERKPS